MSFLNRLLLPAISLFISCCALQLSGCGGPGDATSMTRSEFKAKLKEMGIDSRGGTCESKDFYAAFGEPTTKVEEDPGWNTGHYTVTYQCSDGTLIFEIYDGPSGQEGKETDEVHFMNWVSQ